MYSLGTFVHKATADKNRFLSADNVRINQRFIGHFEHAIGGRTEAAHGRINHHGLAWLPHSDALIYKSLCSLHRLTCLIFFVSHRESDRIVSHIDGRLSTKIGIINEDFRSLPNSGLAVIRALVGPTQARWEAR